MNAALDIAQFVNGLALISLFVALTGSALRQFTGKARQPLDPLWTLLWFGTAHQFGYVASWWFALTYVPFNHTDTLRLLGLRIMSAMIAWAILHRRMVIEGWRW